MDGWNGWTDGNDGWTDVNRWTDGMGGEMDRWNGWRDVNGWTDRTDGQMGSLEFREAQTNIGMQPGVRGRSPWQALIADK